MLNRMPLTNPGLDRWTAWRRALAGSPATTLLKFLAAFALVCLLACAYVWQANSVNSLHHKIERASIETAELEAQQADLIIEVARWISPAEVLTTSTARGLVPPALVYLVAPEAPAPSEQVAYNPVVSVR